MGRKAVSEQVKWQIVGLHQAGDISNREIGRKLNVSEGCVRNTIKTYLNTNDVKDLPRSGRPRKVNERDESIIFRECRKNPRLTNQKLATDFNSKSLNIRISRETVRRILKRKGIGSYKAAKKPMLTPTDRIKRLKWCKERLGWSVEKWSRVIFSDESNFEIFNRKNRIMVKRKKSEKYHPKFCVPRVQKGGGSVGIWGCISHKGTGCCNLYDGRINQYVYIETLENNLIPSAHLFYGESDNWIFQQDGATAHTAISVKKWFQDNKITVMPWCPRSPDLNPIENLWSYVDFKLAQIQITSLPQLKEELFKIWQEIPHDFVMRLIESMPNRVKACYKARGGHIKY